MTNRKPWKRRSVSSSPAEKVASGVAWGFVAAVVVLLVAALLGGCAAVGTTTTIEVPIPVPCEPPEVAAPALPIDSLSPEADIFEHVRALWATVERMEGYESELRTAVDACRRGTPR